ncbi:NAD(P)H-hydrate dehydratase [Lysinibacillus antri]|uniref:Bifunctional NAD(P)H-hydrate repair enzyme n=2 Tax=Lysinibacillus antri TaxID=2498145 RepID=A0A432LCD7_9BACI|nr:NAD(P)H-hydrate dehydratase [Lysinibacillus antri]
MYMYIAGQKEMQLLDQYTMETIGLPGVVLMENAGGAVVQEIVRDFPELKTTIVILAGSGNNGADGFVIARKLMDIGYPVQLWLATEQSKLTGDAKIHFNVYKKRGLPLHFFTEENIELLNSHILLADVIIDALLGTGINGEVRSPIKEIIELVNQSPKPIYAVDIPSGVNATTGEVNNIAVKASKTITFVMPKIGFFVGDGPKFIGEWKAAEISVPENLVVSLNLDLPQLLDEKVAYQALPKRDPHGHKGTFGHCLIVGGSTPYVGAPIYSAKAAFHSGVGLVSLATPETIYPIVAAQCPESLLFPLTGEIKITLPHTLDFSKFKSIAFGPGLGREINGEELLESLFSKVTTQPIVIDADGIYFFKQLIDANKKVPENVILTPHPGEMATLTGPTVAEIEKNRLQIAKEFATQHEIYLLLKGHRPILATPKGELWINPHGNDALGKGGSGDVLTGLIVSFLAQGASPLEAMQAASFYHAIAAEKLGNERSHYGITPTDVIEYIAKNL